MNFNVTYPKGGSNRMWEPMHIAVPLPEAKGLTIQATTFTRDGCLITLLDENQKEMGRYTGFSGMGSPINRYSIAKKICDDMNILLSLGGHPTAIEAEQLLPIMKEVVDKCESRYGNRLPDSDYEALVVFE